MNGFIVRKCELVLQKWMSDRLDQVSSDLRRHHNELLTTAKSDYSDNANSMNLVSGRNMRDYSCQVLKKGRHEEFYFSSLVKNTALNLQLSFKRFFKGSGFPKFKSFQGKWVSLYYDESSKMPTYANGRMLIKLGKDHLGNNLNFECPIKDYVSGGFKNCRIIKEHNKYYMVFCMEHHYKEINGDLNKWISIDQNHTNMFVGIDYKGESIEFSNMSIRKDLSAEIGKVQALLALTSKGSRRNIYLGKILAGLYTKGNEQIKTGLYTLSNYLCKQYNTIVIGDYTPKVELTIGRAMRKAMLTNSLIGMFRQILGHTSKKYGNRYEIVDEKYTTMKCCITGVMTKRMCNVRDWMVDGRVVLRDLNAAINIINKVNMDVSIDTDRMNLSTINTHGSYCFRKGLCLKGHKTQ